MKPRAYNLPFSKIKTAIQRSNGEVGGRTIEMAETEFILRVKGYIQHVDQLRKVAVGVGANAFRFCWATSPPSSW